MTARVRRREPGLPVVPAATAVPAARVALAVRAVRFRARVALVVPVVREPTPVVAVTAARVLWPQPVMAAPVVRAAMREPVGQVGSAEARPPVTPGMEATVEPAAMPVPVDSALMGNREMPARLALN